MITSFLKSGLSSLESISIMSSMQGGSNPRGTPQTAPSLPIEKVVEDTLAALSSMLSERLG
jgi:hypothetical protein